MAIKRYKKAVTPDTSESVQPQSQPQPPSNYDTGFQDGRREAVSKIYQELLRFADSMGSEQRLSDRSVRLLADKIRSL